MIETSKKWEGIPVLKNLASLKICCSDWFPVLLSWNVWNSQDPLHRITGKQVKLQNWKNEKDKFKNSGTTK